MRVRLEVAVGVNDGVDRIEALGVAVPAGRIVGAAVRVATRVAVRVAVGVREGTRVRVGRRVRVGTRVGVLGRVCDGTGRAVGVRTGGRVAVGDAGAGLPELGVASAMNCFSFDNPLSPAGL